MDELEIGFRYPLKKKIIIENGILTQNPFYPMSMYSEQTKYDYVHALIGTAKAKKQKITG